MCSTVHARYGDGERVARYGGRCRRIGRGQYLAVYEEETVVGAVVPPVVLPHLCTAPPDSVPLACALYHALTCSVPLSDRDLWGGWA
eukprot:2544927-Rhodomonas_salina.1